MTELIRRFRGLGVALVVLALSAGAVFAAAPSFVPTGSHGTPAVDPSPATEDASEEPSESPEADASESPEPDASQSPGTDLSTSAPDAAPTDNHGALVSMAAQMTTPPDFPNHGAFVSCVAHMKDVTVGTIDWTTVTYESCTAGSSTDGQTSAQTGKANGQAKAAAAKANAAAKKAAHKSNGPSHP